MGHLSKIFEKVPIEIQKRNGFDLSHINCGTAKCGQLTPVLKRLLMPSTKFSLGLAMNVELPPLATNFMGRVDAIVEVFFCPCSILYGGWKQFISNQIATMFPDSQDVIKDNGGYALPVFEVTAEPNWAAQNIASLDASGDGLADFLGLSFTAIPSSTRRYNLLPFLAYHRICDVFYRNPQVTKTWFAVNPNVETSDSRTIRKNVSLIWHSFYTLSPTFDPDTYESASTSCIFSNVNDLTFPDGVSVFEMRQRPWARDYFTAGLIDPHQGDKPIITMPVNSDGETELTISMVRAANSLQKFLEHNNLDQSYSGVMRNHFGVRPSDADLDEPMYLGRLVVPVYQKSVYNTNGAATSSGPSANQFDSILGGKGSHGSMSGEGSIVDSFHVKCFGYLMGIFSLVPHTMYNYGIDRDLMRRELGDFPFPELQSVGMDSIKNSEIYGSAGSFAEDDFCYTQRYAYEKYINDTAHGELRPGKSLESFVLQRKFDSLPEFGSEFLTIPQDALDTVFAVSTSESNFNCWYEIFWVFKASMPLAEYSIPTLGDLKDTYTIHTTQGGSRL